MGSILTVDELVSACSRGGASALTMVTELEPAGGWTTVVAPARYTSARGTSEYVFYDAFLPDETGAPRRCAAVLIDAVTSQGNRVEAAISDAIRENNPVFTRMPRIEVEYQRDGVTEVYRDLDLPHRAFDGHIRAGHLDGTPTTQSPAYITLRNSTVSDARPMLEASPITLTGGWDASRSARGGKFPRPLHSEIVGVVSDQETGLVTEPRKRSGARVDPVGASIRMTKTESQALIEDQKSEMSSKSAANPIKIDKKDQRGSMSFMGLGAIPPGIDELDGIAVSRILRTSVLSFATLRQLRFGGSPEQDAVLRALLAAVLIDGQIRADADLNLRAGCHLIEASATTMQLKGPQGRIVDVDLLSIVDADKLLQNAFDRAVETADLNWDGQVLSVTGNPAIIGGAVDDADDAESAV